MSDVNSVCVSGNLAQDPEQGNGVLRFCVAVNRSVKNEDGSWREDASFVDCKVFGNRAQSLSGILAKGMQVTVQGELRQERWQDQDGNGRSKLVVVAREVKLPPRPRDAQQAPQAYPSQAAPQQYQAVEYRPQPYAPQQYQAVEYRPQAVPQQCQPAQYQQQPIPGMPPAQQVQPAPPAPSVYDDEIPF